MQTESQHPESKKQPSGFASAVFSYIKAKKSVLLTLVGLGISAFFLYLFLRDINYQETWQALQQANYLWLIPGMLAISASLLGRAYRWRVFLGPRHRQIRIRRLFNTLTIGFFGNTVLLFRAGEFLRAFMLARAEPVRFTESFATVVVERVFDLIIVVSAFALMLMIAPFPPEVIESQAETFKELKHYGWILGIGTVVFTTILCIVVRTPQFTHRLLSRLTCWLPAHVQERLLHELESFIHGLGTFNDLRATLRSLVWTVVVWFAILLSEYYTIKAFGFSVSLFSTMILMSFLAFMVMLPQAPGYLGTFQWAAQIVLVFCFGINDSAAKAYAIVLWVVQVSPILVLGLICLHFEGLTIRQLWQSLKTRGQTEPIEEECQS